MENALPPVQPPTVAEAKVSALPIIGFLKRYWMLALFVALAVMLCLNERAFHEFGMLAYIPAAAAMVVVTTFLVRHLIFRKTIEQDLASGQYVKDWQALPSATRQWITCAYTIAILIAVAIVASGIVR